MLLHQYHFSVSEHKLCWSNIQDALILLQYNEENVFGCCLHLVACVCMYVPEGRGSHTYMCISGLVDRVGYSIAGGLRFESWGDNIFKGTGMFLVNRRWEPAHNVYYILTKPQTVS